MARISTLVMLIAALVGLAIDVTVWAVTGKVTHSNSSVIVGDTTLLIWVFVCYLEQRIAA